MNSYGTSFFLLSLLFLSSLVSATHIRGGYIRAKLLQTGSYTYQIEIHQYTDAGSTVGFKSGTLNFGDGSDPVTFGDSPPDFFESLDDEVAYQVYIAKHSFPGPGQYCINYREFNRNASVANMINSVNTPFYIETMLVIDAFVGENSTPVIHTVFPGKNKLDHIYRYPLIVTDPDGDSISMEPAIVLQDKDKPVEGYFVPGNFEGERIISQMQLHIPDNEIIWANPLLEDEYNYAVKILEWRFNPEMNEFINVGHTHYDFQIIIFDSADEPAHITHIKDTAFLNTDIIQWDFSVLDEENDSLQVRINENFPGSVNFSSDLDEKTYYPSPVSGKILIDNLEDVSGGGPYKLSVYVNPQGSGSISSQLSSMIWITEVEGHPEAPTGLKTSLSFRNKVILEWLDNADNEAGYIIERSSSFFPGFIRIGALPANSTQFTDRNIIPNRDYYYRVKAIGTEGSSYSKILEVKEFDIITDIEKAEENPGLFTLYPNPVKDRLFLSVKNTSPEIQVRIFSLTGLMIKEFFINYPESNIPLEIRLTDLPPDVYFIQVQSDSFNSVKKILKY